MTFLLVLGYLVLCAVAGYAGRTTRVGFWGSFFISILITPPIAIIMMILFHQRRQ